MGHICYTLIDYTKPFGPLVSNVCHYSPDYSAKMTDRGADAFLNGAHIASFDTMEDACRFVTEQSNRHLPWWMRSQPLTPLGE